MSRMWPPEQRLQTIAATPLQRIREPAEIAAVILGLATTMTIVKGTVVTVDGGLKL